MRLEALKAHTLALATAAGLALASGTAAAAVISVDTLEDSVTNNGNCSLREAVIAANTNTVQDKCVAGAGVGTDNIWVLLVGTINLNSNLPLLEKVTILGAGKDATTISGQGSSGVFHVNMPDDTDNVTISNLTIADGKTTLPGAGLLVDMAGRVRVENCRFRNNQSEGYVGGAIATRLPFGTSSSLEVVQCEFIDNSADNGVTGYGGAIGIDGVGNAAPTSVEIDRSSFIGNHSRAGGALYLYDVNSTSVDRSRFHDNDGGFGGAIYWSTGSSGSGTLAISSSNLTDNRSSSQGGAIYLDRGLFTSITNSTFSGNSTQNAVGRVLHVINGTVGVFHSSFIDNGSINNVSESVLHAGSGGNIQMTHSIVWSPESSIDPACNTSDDGVFQSLGYNIDAGTSCSGAGTDFSNVADPGLFPLGDYGDNTGALALETYLPHPGGLAIDGGKDGPCTEAFGVTLPSDQRGEARPTDGDGSGGDAECDIGAVEYQAGVDPVGRTLSLAIIGSGYGYITNADDDTLCYTNISPCNHELPDGSDITLTATANAGNVFVGWSGACAGQGTGPCTLTMNQNYTVSAEFQPAAEPASLTVTKNLRPLGIDATITSTPSGINCGATCSANFEVDDQIVLTAAPLPGTAVSGWSGCNSVSGNGLQCTITLTGDSNVGVTLAAQGASIFADGFE